MNGTLFGRNTLSLPVVLRAFGMGLFLSTHTGMVVRGRMHIQIFVLWTGMVVRGRMHIQIFVLWTEMVVRGRPSQLLATSQHDSPQVFRTILNFSLLFGHPTPRN